MPLIFHLSSLEIEEKPSQLLINLANDISNQKPDLVIISGNIVKKATLQNFMAASDFLDLFNAPVFCVSGNRDLALFGKGFWFLDPFLFYRNHISPTQNCVFEDDHFYAVGINTARAIIPHWKRSNGMVSQTQIEFVHNQFRYAPNEKVRIFVCHHPLVGSENGTQKSLIWGSTDLLLALEDQHVDVILTDSLNDVMFLPNQESKFGPIMVGCQTRLTYKKTSVSYNIIHASPNSIKIDMMAYDGKGHVEIDSHTILRPEIEPETHDQDHD